MQQEMNQRVSGRAIWRTGACGLIAVVLLSACSSEPRYETVTDGGRLIRLDSRDGQVAVVTGETVRILPEIHASPSPAPTSDALVTAANLHEWPTLDLPAFKQTTYLAVKSKWKDGKLYVRARCRPYGKDLAAARDEDWNDRKGFTVHFVDTDGFKLLETDLPLRKMTRIVNDSGKVDYLEADRTIDCIYETYRSIAGVTAPWRD